MVLNPSDGFKTLDFVKPDIIPEANIQAELYHLCKINNIPCLLEYVYKINKYRRRSTCRFDMIIIKNNKIIGIVEIKNYTEQFQPSYQTRQFRKYKCLGVKIIVCNRESEIDKTFQEIKELYNSKLA